MAAVSPSPASSSRDSVAALALLRRPAVDAAAGPAWLLSLRREAWERFEKRGWPTIRDEDWKYTNLAPLSRRRFVQSAPGSLAMADAAVAAAVEKAGLRLHGGIRLVFVDGLFAPSLSSTRELPTGVTVGSLAQALREHPELVEPHLGRIAAGRDRPLADLSTALFHDGAFVHVAKDTCLPVPIEILYAATGSTSGSDDALPVSFPRTLVVAQPETRVTVVERHLPLGAGAYAAFPVTEVALARNAAVEHVLWQEDDDAASHVGTVEARLLASSRFTAHALTLGGALVRTDTGVTLEAEGAECVLNGLYVLFGSRHADHHTRIVHAKPHGTSRELYKGILDGKGTGVFNGKVIVLPGAVKTDSQQGNHNLLLSADAVAYTKPELEIDNDDVKCAHGATVGRLDDDKVFYLRSRGIDAQAARDLLVRAFARDVTDRISIEPVRAYLESWMTHRLPALAGRAGVA